MPVQGNGSWLLKLDFGDAPEICVQLTKYSSEQGIHQAVQARIGTQDALLSFSDPSNNGSIVMLADLLASIKEEDHPCAGEVDRQQKHVLLHCKATAKFIPPAVDLQPMQPQASASQPKTAVKGGRVQNPESSKKGQNQGNQLPTTATDSMLHVAGLLLQRSRSPPYAFLQLNQQPVWAWALVVSVVEGLAQRADKPKGVGERALKR